MTADDATPHALPLTPLARSVLARVAAGLAVPTYGSADFDSLADQDPRRAAAVIIAAECWRDHCSPGRVAADLRRQLLEEEAAVWRRIRETSWDVSASTDWVAQSRRLTWDELCDRRGEPERRGRRPATHDLGATA